MPKTGHSDTEVLEVKGSVLDAHYLALLLPMTYRFNNRGQSASVPVFMRALDLLSALYASQRLPLPLRGVLLVGY